jgi:hypothetical protein
MRARLQEFAKTLPEPESSYFTTIDYWYYDDRRGDGHKEMYGCLRSIFERERQLSAYSEPLRIEYAEKKWASQQAFLESLDRQARIGNELSMTSPAGIFRILASSICATDRRTHEETLGSARRYRETFVNYLRGKDIFRSFLWITPTPPESFPTADAIVEKRTGGEFKTLKAYAAWAAQQKDVFERYQKLQKVKVSGDQPGDYPYLNVNDMPAYARSPRSLLVVFESNIMRLGLLVVEGIFLFYLGYIAFIRYDVR